MIAKNIKRNDPRAYGILAQYIAAAKKKGEKLDSYWAVNCIAGDTLDAIDLQIIEVEVTQEQNTRVEADKTYHLMVSFRDEKPSAEALIDIEKEMATALGFQDHQRVVGTHQNTDNFHMHVAYNKIHPVTHNIHHPKHDYMALERACRSLEAKYNLKVDKGRGERSERDLKTGRARDKEANTWEQSFAGYVKEKHPELDAGRKKAKTWQDLHNSFAEYGLKFNLRGAGLVITDAGHKSRNMKASSLARQFSKDKLEKQLGEFEPARENELVVPRFRYERRPITKHKHQGPLWNKFQTGLTSAALDNIAYRNWRKFLQMEAAGDPLAREIILAQQLLTSSITRTTGLSR